MRKHGLIAVGKEPSTRSSDPRPLRYCGQESCLSSYAAATPWLTLPLYAQTRTSTVRWPPKVAHDTKKCGCKTAPRLVNGQALSAWAQRSAWDQSHVDFRDYPRSAPWFCRHSQSRFGRRHSQRRCQILARPCHQFQALQTCVRRCWHASSLLVDCSAFVAMLWNALSSPWPDARAKCLWTKQVIVALRWLSVFVKHCAGTIQHSFILNSYLGTDDEITLLLDASPWTGGVLLFRSVPAMLFSDPHV